MKDDLSDFAEPLRPLKFLTPDHNPNHHIKNCANNYQLNDLGFEVATLFKRNGKYYLGSTDKYEDRYSMMIATQTIFTALTLDAMRVYHATGVQTFFGRIVAIGSPAFSGTINKPRAAKNQPSSKWSLMMKERYMWRKVSPGLS